MRWSPWSAVVPATCLYGCAGDDLPQPERRPARSARPTTRSTCGPDNLRTRRMPRTWMTPMRNTSWAVAGWWMASLLACEDLPVTEAPNCLTREIAGEIAATGLDSLDRLTRLGLSPVV